MTLDREILNNPDANTPCICSPLCSPPFFHLLFNSRPEIRLAKAWENYREPKPLLLPASDGEIKRGHVRRCYQSAGNPTPSLCISVLPGLAGPEPWWNRFPTLVHSNGRRRQLQKERSIIDFSNKHANGPGTAVEGWVEFTLIRRFEPGGISVHERVIGRPGVSDHWYASLCNHGSIPQISAGTYFFDAAWNFPPCLLRGKCPRSAKMNPGIDSYVSSFTCFGGWFGS